MPWTRTNLVAVTSIGYMLIPLALASYALHTIRTQSLPISKTLSAFTLALPPAALLVLQPIFSLLGQESHIGKVRVAFPQTLLLHILLIYESAVAALIGTHLGPAQGLRCGLDERWRSLYHFKNGDAVRRIQDAFQCCGLHSVVDMAWPFPGGGNEPGTCQRNYARNNSCFEPWQAQEQKVAGLMLATVMMVFLWKAVATWSLFHGLHLRAYSQHTHADEEDTLRRRNDRALDYSNDNNRYLDEPTNVQGSANLEEAHEDRESEDAESTRLLL